MRLQMRMVQETLLEEVRAANGALVQLWLARAIFAHPGPLTHAVRCDLHDVTEGHTSRQDARRAMQHPERWCDRCAELSEPEHHVCGYCGGRATRTYGDSASCEACASD